MTVYDIKIHPDNLTRISHMHDPVHITNLRKFIQISIANIKKAGATFKLPRLVTPPLSLIMDNTHLTTPLTAQRNNHQPKTESINGATADTGMVRPTSQPVAQQAIQRHFANNQSYLGALTAMAMRYLSSFSCHYQRPQRSSSHRYGSTSLFG